MPSSLTLAHLKPLVVKNYCGWDVPWETTGFRDEERNAEMAGGMFDLSSWGVVVVTGPDALDFLHRMSTANLKELRPGRVAHVAFLTGKANVISMGMVLFQKSGEYGILVPPGQAAPLAEHLEKFHFGENLTVEDASHRFALLGLWVHESTARFKLPSEPFFLKALENDDSLPVLWSDDCRESLHFLLTDRSGFSDCWELAASEGFRPLGIKLFEFFRISHGVPQAGIELKESEIILEGGFDRAVARSKGCYPGQEVVERIFTYGQVNRKLMVVDVEWRGDLLPETPFSVAVDGKPAISVVSLAENPSRHLCGAGLAFVHKNYWDFKEKFKADNGVTLTIKKA